MLDVLLNNQGNTKQRERVSELHYRPDKPVKSFLKSLSWRIVGTLDTIIISYIITGKLSFAVSIGGIEVITKTILYYFHERLWARMHKIRFTLLKKSDDKQNEYNRTERITRGKISLRFIKNTDLTVHRTNTIYKQFWN